jgi:hypothetical protein
VQGVGFFFVKISAGIVGGRRFQAKKPHQCIRLQNTAASYEEDIMSAQDIVVIALLGFIVCIVVVVGIMKMRPPKENEKDNSQH